jgi:hypothetical protein
MGEIVAFPSSRRRVREPSAFPASGEAQILFFTGVRYVKLDDEALGESRPALKSRNAVSRNRRRKRRA